jgi:hypothetical protein
MKMRTLKIIKEFDENTHESPHRLIVDGVKTGARFNADTKNDIGDCEEFAFILVSELDQELMYVLDKTEKAKLYGQILEYLNKLPD